MAERIADYCEAILAIESLCKVGFKCCVSRDAFGLSPPPELMVIDRSNSSRYDEKIQLSNKSVLTSTAWPSTDVSIVSLATLTTTTQTPSLTTVQTDEKRPTLRKPCSGACIYGILATFLCPTIDEDADCAGEGSCCIIDVSGTSVSFKFDRSFESL